jgi:ABC-type multidrug transport system ATPase subunit
MIRARSLTKKFGQAAVLSGIDLDVAAGERVAVLGLNGVGKTTLIRCLLGLTRYQGELQLAGYEVRSEGREARARVGYVPQRPPQLDGTLREIVRFFSRLRGVSVATAHARLNDLGLPVEEHGDKFVRELSGGMLQKALLALALGAEVPVLLLDEPTANLDARARKEFLSALAQADEGTTILFATHRLADVDAVADRLLVMHDGGIAFSGAPQQLWEAVGANITLWIKVRGDDRDAVSRRLRARHGLATVLDNGSALGVRVKRSIRADVLAELREMNVPVEDFWTESPSLHDLMERILGTVALPSHEEEE